MNSIAKPLINSITLAGAIFINYWANSGQLNGKNVGEVSERYETLFTPAAYAFSIWGLIYLMLCAYVGYQWHQWRTGRYAGLLERGGWWFTLANIANGSWVVVWLNEWTGLSVVIMLILLLSLVMLVIRLDLERWDAPLDVIAFNWWPLTIYLGWIVVATVANIAAFLVSNGWYGGPLGQPAWTIVLIAVAAAVYVFLTFSRSMREASFVGVWALIAIAVAQWGSHPGVAYTAVAAAAVVFFTAAYQGYKNRHVSALAKLQ